MVCGTDFNAPPRLAESRARRPLFTDWNEHDLDFGNIGYGHFLNQPYQFVPELPHIQRLRDDESDIKRRLQPAAHEYPARHHLHTTLRHCCCRFLFHVLSCF